MLQRWPSHLLPQDCNEDNPDSARLKRSGQTFQLVLNNENHTETIVWSGRYLDDKTLLFTICA